MGFPSVPWWSHQQRTGVVEGRYWETGGASVCAKFQQGGLRRSSKRGFISSSAACSFKFNPVYDQGVCGSHGSPSGTIPEPSIAPPVDIGDVFEEAAALQARRKLLVGSPERADHRLFLA